MRTANTRRRSSAGSLTRRPVSGLMCGSGVAVGISTGVDVTGTDVGVGIAVAVLVAVGTDVSVGTDVKVGLGVWVGNASATSVDISSSLMGFSWSLQATNASRATAKTITSTPLAMRCQWAAL